MADYEARVGIDFDVTQATAALQRLQQQISAFQSALGKGSAASAKAASNLQRDLLNNINATGKFAASMTTVSSSAENFTRALENNKLSLGQYFRYAGASTKTFGRFFKSEFDTINKVVRERVKTIQTQFVKMGRDSNGALQAIKIRPLALDLQNYGTQAQMAAQRQAVFNQLIKQGSTNLLNFGKNTQWAGRQLMVGFTIPLSIMGATAVKEFEKIEKQAIRFKRVYGDAFSTTAETDEALKNVRELAKEFTKYGLEVEKTLELAADAAQMGLKGTDLLAQVTEATRLAVLGEVEQQEALETSISLTNAFGISAEELANKINFLNAVENETVTAISDLTTAIPKAGPVIQQLGGSVEDLAFFLTAMKEGGINASEGANALKSGLAKIINPTEKASQMLGGLGINIRGIVEANAGDIKSTVLELADALDSLDPLNRARAIEELFGRFQFARISTLFQNIVKEGSQAERVLKLSKASAEELAILSERELKRVEDSPLFKFQKQIEQLQAALAPLGEEFLKAITPLIEFAKGFLDNFNNMSDGAKRFAVVATTVIAGIGPIALMTFGLIANGVANLIKMFAGIGRMFTGFGQKTTDLGLQTQYLTNEQLESQAAAISMGQAHGQLTQVLTSETAAVSQLAAAYNTMTAAQRRAAAMQGVKLPGPGSAGLKKYAKGVVSVPGPKGAGDIVPAMLSPGEAVIPAKQAKEYSGLIRGMISNTIPKFSDGTESVKKTQASIHRTASTTGIIAAHGIGHQRLSPQQAKEWAKKNLDPRSPAYQNFMRDTNLSRRLYSNLVFGMPGSFNTGNMSGTNAASWVRKNPKAFLAYLTNMQGIDPNSAAAKSYVSSVSQGLARYRNTLIKDEQFFKVIANAGKRVTDPFFKQALTKASTTFATGSLLNSSGTRMRTHQALSGMGPSYTKRRDPIRKLYGPQATAFEQGLVKSTTGTPKPSGVKRVGGKPADNRVVAVSNGETIVSKRSTDALRRGKFAFIPNLGVIGKADGMPAGQSPVEQRVDSRGRTYYYAPGKGRVSAATAQQMMTQQPGTGKMPRFGAGGVGMALGMGAMAYSMTGGPGADIAGMASLPLFMLPQLIQMLKNPIGLAVTALGGLMVAAFALSEQFKKNVKESYELTMSTGASSKALEEFAEFGGNVTAGQIMDRRRSEGPDIFQIAQGKTQFGEAYLQSEAGQQVLTSFGKNIEKLGRSGAMQTLSNQMAVAVASGALQPAQARDIVAALGKELNDYNLSIEINSKLLTLLGPNGENLVTDPLSIRMNIVEESRQAFGLENIVGNLEDIANMGKFGTRNILTGKFTAYKNEEDLSFIEKTLGSIGLSDAVTDSPFTFLTYQDQLGLTDEQIGSFIGLSTIAVQTQQEMVDALQIDYEQRIANAKEQGKLAEAARLEVEYAKAKNALLLENKTTYSEINSIFSKIGNGESVLLGMSEQIKTMFKDDPTMSGVVGGLLEGIEKLDEDKELTLKLALLSGDISPIALNNMFNNMTQTATVELITKLGTTGAVSASNLAALFGEKTTEINVGGPDVARGAAVSQTVVTKISDQIITKVLGMTPGAAAEYVEQFDPVIQSLSALGESGFQEGLKFFFENPETLKEVNEELDLFKDKVGDGKVTLELVQEVYGQKMVDEIKANQDYFDKLDKDQKIIYTTVLEVLGKIDPVALQAMAINASLAGGLAFDKFKDISGGMSLKGMQQAYARYGPQGTGFAKTPETLAIEAFKEAYAEMLTSIMSPSGLGGEGEDVGEGGKNVLDDIFDRLKRVRNAAVGAKRDIDELIRLMKPGTNTTKFFRGTDQKLLLAGYGREFIDAVMGMDEETRGNFVSIKNGVVKVTEAGKALNKAFSEITLGDFQLSLLQGVADTNKQIQALNTLIGKGMSVANAMDVVSDASLAYAIATATTDEEVIKLINDFKRLEAAQRNLNFQTKEGSAEEFGKIYDKATGFLEAQKSTLNAQFEINTNADQDIIREAQDDINALNFELDNYQAELSSIEQQENEVNKRYDDRIDALNKIQSVNEEIARQEAANLKIADAVAAGDIAAAARALRDKQAEEAAAAAKRREAAIEQARELELSKLVSNNGRTREEIQNKVRDIQLEILKIEEERLEPAQERIRLLDVERQKALDSLDDQIDKWNLLSAQVNESKLSLSEAEMSALEYQAGLIQQMLKDWDNIENREATLTIIKKTFGDDAIGPGSDLPTSSTPSAGSEVVNPNQAEIDELNRLRKISREKYRTSTDEAYKKRLWDINVARGQRIKALGGIPMAKGGLVKYYPLGGLIPYMNSGGLFKSINTDTVPAMLTPGEFVMRRNSVNKYGTDMMKAINTGTYSGNSMYNYSVSVNVKTDANPDQIARAVMTQIRSVESQKIRGNRF